MAIIVELQKFKQIPDGEYEAELVGVSEHVGKNGPIIRFKFNIVEPGYETSVTGICSKLLTPKSKLFKWIQAFGGVITADSVIDLESFIGCRVIVDVAINEDGGNQYLNVVGVKKLGRRIIHSQSVPNQIPTPTMQSQSQINSNVNQGMPTQTTSSSDPNVVNQHVQTPNSTSLYGNQHARAQVSTDPQLTNRVNVTSTGFSNVSNSTNTGFVVKREQNTMDEFSQVLESLDDVTFEE